MRKLTHLITAASLVAAAALAATSASAQEKVRVGANPVSASLPLYVGMKQGFFKDEGLDLEVTQIIGPPANIAALISNQIDVASNVTTIDSANATLKKPGATMFIALNSQNATYQMEQFVIRKDLDVKTIADLKGKKIASAPGPGNVVMAKAILKANGLGPTDYTLDQLDLAQHVNSITAGTFDAVYTLEPAATILRKSGAGKTLEAGVVAHYVLGDPQANGWIAGTAMTSDFVKAHPDAAKKFASAWAKSIKWIDANTAEARKAMVGNIAIAPDVAEVVPLVKFTMTSDLTQKDIADFQKFIDFSSDNGILSGKVDVTTMLQKF